MNAVDLSAKLADEVWEPGRVIHLAQGSQRHRVVLTCYEKGRQTAQFANGEHAYGAYVEITRPDGSWIPQGVNVVPVLPDGRIIMIVEQRPPQGRFQEQIAKEFRCGGQLIPFSAYGPYSSLEFPGGAINPGESFNAGFLRELSEETGVAEQTAEMWERLPPFFQTGADVAIAMRTYVIFLNNMHYEKEVTNDGGLSVLALQPNEVDENIWRGAIVAAQAGLVSWSFYQEVRHARRSEDLRGMLTDIGYLRQDTVRIG